MYSWGGSTADWKGSRKYDYGSARAKYDKAASSAGAKGPRTYIRASAPNEKLTDPRGKVISSDSADPIIIGVDVTGSMASWPAEIFDRLPLLYQTLAKYRPNTEFSFCAIGDATIDSYPLQVTDFDKSIKGLEAKLKALGCEGGGGGQIMESYELFGHFMDTHCKTPKATSPFLLIFGDEKFYDRVDPSQVEHYIGDKLESPISSEKMWHSLMQKFNLYLLHKPYGGGHDRATDREVVKRWGSVIGPQRVIELPSSDRAVDIAMGLIAKHWGEYGDFTRNLDARHDDSDLKKTVHGTLRFIDVDPKPKSMLLKSPGSSKTKSLLDK